MKTYTTLRGATHDLGDLAPWELGILWGQLRFVGNFSSLLSDDPAPMDPEALASLPDPDLFQRSWQALVDTRMAPADRARLSQGPLPEIMEDIRLRLGMKKRGWSKDVLLHDPRVFLRDLREASPSLGDFAATYFGSPSDTASQRRSTASQISRALTVLENEMSGIIEPSNKVSLTIPALREAAQRAGLTVEFHPRRTDATLPHSSSASCRDIAQQQLGARLSTAWRLLTHLGVPKLSQYLSLEYKARAGLDRWKDGFGTLLSLIESSGKVTIGPEPAANLLVANLGGTESDIATFAARNAWLLFGIEFNWFAKRGYYPLTLDQERFHGLKRQLDASTIQLSPSAVGAVRHALVDPALFVQFELFDGRFRPWTPAVQPAGDTQAQLDGLHREFQLWAQALCTNPDLKMFTRPLIESWYLALASQPDLRCEWDDGRLVEAFANIGLLPGEVFVAEAARPAPRRVSFFPAAQEGKHEFAPAARRAVPDPNPRKVA